MPFSAILPSQQRALGALSAALCCSLFAPVAFATADSPVAYRFDFAGEPGVPTEAWMADRDFRLEHDAKKPDKIHLAQSDGALHINVNKKSFGIILHEQDVPGAKHVHLHWGVSAYPEGASYEHGIDNEAIMVYVFFGHEKMSSGSLFIPDSPYFIGFFLCPPGSDALGQPYVGHHYQKTGRYICVDHPPSGEKVLTRLDLAAEFRKSFGLEAVPMVSGISIEVDTTDAMNDGTAAAFLERIDFLE